MKRSSTARRGEQAKEEDDGLSVDVTKLRVLGRGLTVGKRIGLRTLREASEITQVTVAERMGIEQSQVSKIEAGEDHLVSTLRRYAEALDGKLHVEIELAGRRYRIGGSTNKAQQAGDHRLECAEPARAQSTRAKLRRGG